MRVCAYEDRPTDAVGVKILVLSLLQHCPGTSIDLKLPFASPDLLRWFEGKPGVRVSTARDPSRSGYQVKARLLLDALDAGATEAVWLDTDIVVAGDLAGKLAAFPADAIVVAQEYFGAPGQGGSQRTRAFGLEPGRRMPDTANTCVVRVTPSHRELLEEWDRLLTSGDYRDAQARQWFERPLHLLGDQDVLTALLGSARFAKTPIGWLRRGSDVAQCFEHGGYPAHERIRNLLAREKPVLLHSQGEKPWRPPGGRRRLHLEVSPYTLASSAYAQDLGEDSAWMAPQLRLSRLLRKALRGHPTATGLLPAVARELRDQRVLKTWVRSFFARG
jgi:hypothetical protein